MKKAFALILSIVMMLSLAVPAFATETAESRESVVSLELDPSLEHYTLTIPATITIDPAKKSATLNVTLEDVALVWHDYLDVYAVPTNRDPEQGGAFLVNTEDSTKKIHYTLEDFNGNIDEGRGAALHPAYAFWTGGSNKELTVESGWIKLAVDGEYPGAGTYTDTLTFTVEMR